MGILYRKDYRGRYGLGAWLDCVSSCWLDLGPLHIYRVPGSVAFINSGDTLHPILPRSQCWCVDGESKFVLRIRENDYYRIELPNNCADDNSKVEELKQILPKVLRYERTRCPFKRGFTVSLPEPPKTPIQKRPWKPKHRSVTMIETHSQKMETEERYAPAVSESSSDESRNRDHDSDPTDYNGNRRGDEVDSSQDEGVDAVKTPTRPKALVSGRTFTAPPQLTLRTTPPSNTIRTVSQPSVLETETSSLSSSVDSFHSFHSFHSPGSSIPPSPPYSDPPSPSERSAPVYGIDIPRTRQHKRDISELTVTGETSTSWDTTTPNLRKEKDPSSPLSPPSPQTPALTDDAVSQGDEFSPDLKTPSPTTALRRRPIPPQRRAHSPLPSPTNLYSPRARMSGHHLTTAILQKTCSLLLGPPIQLVALMLNIAARITNGALQGSSLESGEAGPRIPCTWEHSDTDNDAEDFWEEDDYGISLGKMPASRTTAFRDMDGSWEID